jgi:predicted HicB family RNase H-like nuclease
VYDAPVTLKKPREQLNIRIAEDLHERLRRLAREKGITVSELVRELVREAA